MKVLILFYSVYGHIYKLARAVSEGVMQVRGASAELKRVPETLPESILKQIGAIEGQKEFSHIPICTIEELPLYDAIIFGTPTRFGMMCGQMKQFLDGTGPLWVKHAFVGKPAGVFTSSRTQHGGQESTILNFHTVLLHLGNYLGAIRQWEKLQAKNNCLFCLVDLHALTVFQDPRAVKERMVIGSGFMKK